MKLKNLILLAVGVMLGACSSDPIKDDRPMFPLPHEDDVPRFSVGGFVNDEGSQIGVVRFSGPVVSGAASSFEAALDVASAGKDALVVVLDTPGGLVGEGFQLAKTIEAEGRDKPVVCIVDGIAASMGFFILQSCPTRTMTKRSRLMVHEASSGVIGGADAHEQTAERLRQINAVMAVHQCGRLHMSVEECYLRYAGKTGQFGWTMLAPEALAVGAIDAVAVAAP